MADRFLIAPMKSGLVTALPAWQIPEDAFFQLRNAYVFRGRVTKRCGTELMGSGASSLETEHLLSRLRVMVATTDGAGAASGTVPGVIFGIGQQFSIGTEIFTVNVTGTPAVMLTTGSSVIHTYNTTTGAYNFTGAAALTPVYFYPGQPVMGINNFESGPVNEQPTIAYDTQFAYQFVTSAWTRIGTAVWHGDDLNYFWSSNWQGDPGVTLLYVSNFQVTNPNGASVVTDDPLWYWDGSAWTSLTGSAIFAFFPNGNAHDDSPYVFTARIILPFKNRLILLNTIENDNSGGTKGQPGFGVNTQYVNRCRYSIIGSPLAVNAWYEREQSDAAGNNYAGAGYIDAPTTEEIIAAEFIKDRLIVYFEQSTWELAYTGNEIEPFAWQQINTELGAIGTFSTVPFDRAVLGIGDTGVHSCSGANVDRIDNNIPDQIFEISKEDNGAQRIAGIRDYFSELVYWSYPSVSLSRINTKRYPDKMLVYNYANSTWAIWDDTFLSYGYFYPAADVEWQSLHESWESYDIDWTSGVQFSRQRRVIAGNQQGFVVMITRDQDFNAQSYIITGVSIGANDNITLTVISHNLSVGDYIFILELPGIVGFTNLSIHPILVVTTVNTIVILVSGLSGTYRGGGTFARVPKIDILSKQWNPYISKGRSLFVGYIDFCVQRTATSEITVDYYSSSSHLSTIQAGQATGSILGSSILETRPYAIKSFEQVQDILWHRVYFQIDGQFIQIRLYWSDDQMRDKNISLEDFTMEGLVLSTQPTSYSLDI
jgi:hypothetical protein